MSRRIALATIASGAASASAQAAPSLVIAADPAVLARQRCIDAQPMYAAVSQYAERTGDFAKEEEASAVYCDLCWDLIETPATTLAGVIAKIEEAFEDDIKNAPPADMQSATLLSVIDDLRRIAARASV
jgi:hypothetical protein